MPKDLHICNNNNQAQPLSSLEHRLRETEFLFSIAKGLDESLNIEDVLLPTLKKLADYLGLRRGAITILNRDTKEIEIDMAYGLSAEEQSRGRYRLGEGITGKVVQTGRPAIIEQVSNEPAFLDRTRTRRREARHTDRDLSFICVPIRIGQEIVGALSFDRPHAPAAALREDARMMSIVATLLAQAVRLRREARERERALVEENVRLSATLRETFKPARLIGHSHALMRVCRLIEQVAPSDATVLLRGESGVGKELVAEAIHLNSARAGRAFVKVNLAALPETIVESELFGHEKGAFTGAIAARKGRFELADGGTLFLDEIGDLPPSIQVKLLRVLQEREFERIGGDRTIRADVRIVAATNRDLEKAIETGGFRMDLYYRLNVFPIFIPPLRERGADIMLLADFFAERTARKHGVAIKRISTPAIDMLMSYHWPGNVRELENVIERAVLLSEDRVIHGHHLPPSLQTAEASNTLPKGRLDASLAALERELILDALKTERGNAAKAARLLGISERVIGLRIKKLGIEPARFRPSGEQGQAAKADRIG